MSEKMGAEEATNKILYQYVGEDWGRSVESASQYRFLYPIVLKGLTQYAEERVKEALQNKQDDKFNSKQMNYAVERARALKPPSGDTRE